MSEREWCNRGGKNEVRINGEACWMERKGGGSFLAGEALTVLTTSKLVTAGRVAGNNSSNIN